jgi:hypothetical protein
MGSQEAPETKRDPMKCDAVVHGGYKYKNLTVYVKHEYSQGKRFCDIITSLIMQGVSEGETIPKGA